VSKIALDAMGGDNAPDINIRGAYLAALANKSIEITLVGIEAELLPLIKEFSDWPYDQITIQQASEVVTMSDSPGQSFRKKKDSSIVVGLNLVKKKICDAFVSAGNTGAVMTSAIFTLGRIKSVDRPPLAAVIPSQTRPFVLLDVGSNVDCKPEHLKQFAIMGNLFSKFVLKVDSPRVGLLNIGSEKEKGNIVTQDAHALLESESINFIGNIEGKEITKGLADVVVCDGFTGNTLLKFGEGLVSVFKDFLKTHSRNSIICKLGLALSKPLFRKFKTHFDHEQHGGAHLLGINGITIISHGSASPLAIKNAILMAHSGIETNINQMIQNHLTKTETSITQS